MRVRTYEIGDTQQIVKLFYDTVPLQDAIAKYTAVEPHSTGKNCPRLGNLPGRLTQNLPNLYLKKGS